MKMKDLEADRQEPECLRLVASDVCLQILLEEKVLLKPLVLLILGTGS